MYIYIYTRYQHVFLHQFLEGVKLRSLHAGLSETYKQDLGIFSL